MNHLDSTTVLAPKSSSQGPVAQPAWKPRADDSHLWRKYDLSGRDALCFTCPVRPDCVGEHSPRCPIYQARRQAAAARRSAALISDEPVSLFEMSRRLRVSYRLVRLRFNQHRQRFDDVSVGPGRSPRDAYLLPPAAQARLVELVRGGAE